MKSNNFKIYITLYFIVILGIIIFTCQKHKEMEHFGLISTHKKYDDCKNNCLLKYKDDPDKYKACKSYCKCKKKCSTNSLKKKKCKKICKEKKLNLFRDDKDKMKYLEIKDIFKKERRQKKKEKKIKEMEKEKDENEIVDMKTNKKISYLDRIINTYLPEKDKETIININNGSNKFTSDFKKIFLKYFN